MKLDTALIEHIAHLSRLQVSDEEVARYSEQISSILTYVDKLREIDTNGVPELAHGSGTTNVFRADEPVACEADVREKLIEAFPLRQGSLLEVQAVFEERTE